MKLHEYQAKELLARFGMKPPRGKVAHTPDEAEAVAREFGFAAMAVKAQVHAGGRGKGGGIKLARSPEEAKKHAAEIIGMNLVTKQTGPEGKDVHMVLIEEGIEIEKELYLSVTLDRARGLPVLIASSAGGMDIEEVARHSPEKIVKALADPFIGLHPFMGRKVGKRLGFTGKALGRFAAVAVAITRAYLDTDASLVEINPLGVTADGEFLAVDGKVSIDDSALFRHKELAGWRDEREEDPLENRARKTGISYVRLDGTIGCLVNGAGLAMATMDIIKLAGGEPANFLDVGGGANEDQVRQAFEIILEDERVNAILVNIFGGIMRCDTIASGIVGAVKKTSLGVPLVVRLEGTKVAEGRQILADSGLPITAAADMRDAAEKVVEASRGGG